MFDAASFITQDGQFKLLNQSASFRTLRHNIHLYNREVLHACRVTISLFLHP